MSEEQPTSIAEAIPLMVVNSSISTTTGSWLTTVRDWRLKSFTATKCAV